MNLKVGILLPTREAAILGRYSVAPLLDLAQQVEELGFDSVWAGDSLLARPRLDPLIVLSACAAVTRRVVLGTAALTAALRHPLIGANMLASLEHVAPGRLRVGVGAGFPVPESEHEFGALGVPFRGRSARLDETVRLWKQTWTRGSAFHGAIWDLDGLDRLPGPATPGGPRVWLAAGATAPVLGRTAALYDGWLPFLPDPEEYRRAWSRITQLAECVGRAADAIEPGLYATVHLDADRARAEARLEEYVQGYYGRSLEFMSAIQAYHHGSAEQCARWLARFVNAGARHLVLRVGALDPGRQLDLIAGELLPALRAIPADVSSLDYAGSMYV
jgi:alkanesulfonate monooxygenase SsuD/methylene tetrahydromethanopterin reductase-like flavin-dependent oxidoreductase (luciferase family)